MHELDAQSSIRRNDENGSYSPPASSVGSNGGYKFSIKALWGNVSEAVKMLP